MLHFMHNNKQQGWVSFFLLLAYTALGMWYGAQPDSATAGAFGAVIRMFALEPQTRLIVAFILSDALTGMIAALRTNTFSGERVADFMHSDVLAYLFGFLLYWYIVYYALLDLLPYALTDTLASLGFGAIMVALTLSIIDNLTRASYGTSQPSDAASSAMVNNLPPVDPHG